MINIDNIINKLAKNLKLKDFQIKNTLSLISEGNTIPFISRYRKEFTNGLDEEQIFLIQKEYNYQLNLEEKKIWTINAIEKKGKLTDEIISLIDSATKISELENIYKPYAEKKKTRAAIAINLGFEPLANYILTLPKNSIENEVKKYLKDDINYNQALQYVNDIIAEKVSDDYEIRNILKNSIFNYGFLTTKPSKIENDVEKKYKLYYETKLKLNKIPSYKIMAINRAEKEKVISSKFVFDKSFALKQIIWKYTKNFQSDAANIILNAINDGLSRLLIPSVENEIWNEMLENAQNKSIDVFSMNLEHVLSQSPLKEKTVLGIDPAFRTGCKLALVNKNNQMLLIDTIYPNEPHNKIGESEEKLLKIIKENKIDIIAIGNGTASRETEIFINNFLKKHNLNISHVIVNEAGASVYSASELARKEFPDLTVEKRSAISIARRIIDPLSELIKIDPKSIGVGQYQHDVPLKKLDENLDFVIKKIVNRVGVDLNTASNELLVYISGISKSISKAIIDYRNKIGKIQSREELKNIPKINNLVFQQCSGFLRIKDGQNILDETSIHPENYLYANKIIKELNIDLNNDNSQLEISKSVWNKLLNICNNNEFILNQIISAIKEVKRDYRDQFDTPLLRDDVLDIQNLKINMELNGVVRNVCDFGVFIDVGLKNDGFLHFSGMKDFQKPDFNHYEHFYIGQILNLKVKNIDFDNNKIELIQ